ncbi:MAG: carboxypeptidase-like regulatory domain-containing protein [Dysgonamonadaceae bacterium]|jgi:hypothetical protein|nr:carboxypeptidase-like regulatory domain-containing protein [Dysgonamonadaceae bacterium]
MKYLMSFVFSLLLLSACNKEEGLGGSSSLEGYVYAIEHFDDNFTFQTDTFPSLDTEVFLEFGDDLRVGERVRTGREGYYRFEYLRKGSYTVYALSKFPGDYRQAVAKHVQVNDNTSRAETIFIHTGDAVESAMIKGSVWIKYYNKGSLVRVDGQDSIPAVEARVFVRYADEETDFDDARVGDKGIFVFQKIRPGKRYTIHVSSEEITNETYKNILLPISKEIEVTEAYKTYPLEGEDALTFTIKMNN